MTMHTHTGISKRKGKAPVSFYAEEIKIKTKQFFSTLDESSQRRFVGLEASKLGHGGKTYIHNLLGCDFKTIKKGEAELSVTEGLEALKSERIRKKGGGRKSKVHDAKVNAVFLKVISSHTAGSPEEEDQKWTYLNQEEIVNAMRLDQVVVSRRVVRELLPKHNFVKRKSQKKSDGSKQKSE